MVVIVVIARNIEFLEKQELVTSWLCLGNSYQKFVGSLTSELRMVNSSNLSRASFNLR